jgi:hypothetical protein
VSSYSPLGGSHTTQQKEEWRKSEGLMLKTNHLVAKRQKKVATYKILTYPVVVKCVQQAQLEFTNRHKLKREPLVEKYWFSRNAQRWLIRK